MSSQAPVTTLRQKLLLVGFGLLLFFLLLAAVEGLLALFGLGSPYLYDDPFVGFAPGRDLFALERDADGREVYATRPDKLAFFHQQSFPAEKGDSTYRVFAVGGSTTAGRPYDSRVAFARWLELYLDAADPNREHEVVNAGAISYASYRVALLMQELVRYQPDLFVVYTGHNEFLEERTYGEIIHRHPLLKAVGFHLGRYRFYNLARQAWLALAGDEPEAEAGEDSGGGTLASEVTARLDGWTGVDLYHRDEALRRAVVEHFEFNLRRMVSIARAHGAEILFVSPVSNLKDFSPFKSEPSRPLEPAEERTLRRHLERAAAHLGSGGAEALAAAEAELAQALEIDPEYAEAHFLEGRRLFAAGDVEAADAAFRRAKDLDVAPLRALEEMVAVVGRVAAEEKAAVVDLPRILAADSRSRHGHPVLGNEYLLDHVHPDIPVHSRIAVEILDRLAAAGAFAPDPGWSEDRGRRIYEREVQALDRAYYAQRDLNLAKVLGWSGKLEEARAPLERAAAEMPEHPEVRLNLGILYQRDGRFDRAAEELDRAVALAPEMPEAHFNRGVAYGSLGRLEEGVRSLREAVRLRPDYAEAHFNLGVLERRRGEYDRALTALERARALGAGTESGSGIAAELERELGRVHRERGDLAPARAAFARALDLAPGEAALLTELGITQAREGRLEEAERTLREAVAAEPGDAEARYNLALVHARQGRPDDAMAGYLATVEADPGHAEAHNNLGILYAGSGRAAEAEASFRRAVEARAGYAEAYLNLGVVLDQSGRPAEALAAVARAAELDPGSGRIQLALGSLYLARGDRARAREAFLRAREAGETLPPGLLEQL